MLYFIMMDADNNIEYVVGELCDRQQNLVMETDEAFEAGKDVAVLTVTPNAGIEIMKTKDEEGNDLYEMSLYVTDEVGSYYARMFNQYSVGEPFSRQEIETYLDRLNGAFGQDSKYLCRMD